MCYCTGTTDHTDLNVAHEEIDCFFIDTAATLTAFTNDPLMASYCGLVFVLVLLLRSTGPQCCL